MTEVGLTDLPFPEKEGGRDQAKLIDAAIDKRRSRQDRVADLVKFMRIKIEDRASKHVSTDQ
jgi:hypothetical protein